MMLIEYNQIFEIVNKALMETSLQQDIDLDIYQYQGPTKRLLDLTDTNIKEVWADNFKEQIINMMRLCERFNVIAMDTQFPGICVDRNDSQLSQQENQYQYVRRNVEETKLIQIGFTIADQKGNVPQQYCTWQFNFKFDDRHDKIHGPAKELLIKAKIQFNKLPTYGIDFKDFAQYMVGSDIIYNPNIKWVVFHGSYDFAYLLRLMKNQPLPLTIDEFYREMKLLFPTIYDLKYIIKDNRDLKQVGLNRLGQKIGCSRIGPQHQAGSDSLLTEFCYFRMWQKAQTKSSMKNNELINVIFGIGKGLILNHTRGGGGSSDFFENSSNQYYDHRQGMMGHHHHSYSLNSMNGMGMNMVGHQAPNPLYHYFQQQQQPLYMYPNEYHRRH